MRLTTVGSNLARLALSPLWAHIPHPASRILTFMAMTAIDPPGTAHEPAHSLYFGGTMPLIMCTEGKEPEGRKDTQRARNNIYRALRILVQAGAIESVLEGKPGQRAVYKLTLTPPRTRATVTPIRPPEPTSDPGIFSTCTSPHDIHVRHRATYTV